MKLAIYLDLAMSTTVGLCILSCEAEAYSDASFLHDDVAMAFTMSLC